MGIDKAPNVNWPLIGRERLSAIQLAQFRHDETYHREITRLTVKDRLTHMALHFAKYAGLLASGLDEKELQRVVTDIFVIGVSTINSLNVPLYPCLVEQGPTNDVSVLDLTRNVTVLAGKMAAACEKLDHLESFPYRETIRSSAVALVANAMSAASERGWDIETLVADRLQPIKEKSIFYGHI